MKVNEAMAARRKELNLTLDEVAKAVGVSKATVFRWESGEIDNMRRDRIAALARILQVSPIFFMDEQIDIEKYSNNIPKAKNIIPFAPDRVPLVGRIAAGTPILAEQNIDGYENIAGGIKADFCLEVQGDSMINANIHSGDIVFIRQQDEVENGEIAAVLIDDSATLKRFYKTDDTATLVAENPLYLPMVFHDGDCDNFKILGKAVALQTLVK